MLTKDMVEKALPAKLRSSVSQTLVDQLNNIEKDPVIAENIRENFLGYSKVLSEGRFKTEDYLHAVAYVSYKVMGYSNHDAYFRTFPTRYQQLLAKNATPKDISAYVSMYNKGKLVNLIMEQTLVPVWVLNQDLYQEALNTQAEIMRNANSDMVRTTAANSLLVHLTKPKEAAAAIQINLQENSGMVELRNSLIKLAEQQRALVEQGVSSKDVAAQPLVIEGVVEEEDV